eukprot:scaffold31985_cov67-Phaeocystis_antarctica.AAC.1
MVDRDRLADDHRVRWASATDDVVVVTFIRSKATGHTSSTDPSRSHYITSVGGRLKPTHRRRKPQAPAA